MEEWTRGVSKVLLVDDDSLRSLFFYRHQFRPEFRRARAKKTVEKPNSLGLGGVPRGKRTMRRALVEGEGLNLRLIEEEEKGVHVGVSERGGIATTGWSGLGNLKDFEKSLILQHFQREF